MPGFNQPDINSNGTRIAILPTQTITTARTAETTYSSGGANGRTGLAGVKYVAFNTVFVYGSGGTNATVYLQTSLDGGTTWLDVAAHQFTTATATKYSALTVNTPPTQAAAPTDGALTANTVINGVLGDRFRVKLTTTGTYAGSTTIKADLVLKG